MIINTNINKNDLVKLNLYVFPRSKTTWISFIVIYLGLFLFLCFKPDFEFVYKDILFASITSFINTLVGLTFIFACNLVSVLFMSGDKDGVLGLHKYAIKEGGLHETTEANEALIKWAGISEVIQNNNYILVQINHYLFHVIPKRDFSEQAEFEKFGATLRKKVAESAIQGVQ